MNYIAVRVDCSDEPSSRWYNGCGINRDVFLLTSESDIFVPQYGMKIVTKKEEASWKVAVELQIVDQSSGEKDADIHVYIKDAEGQIVAKAKRGISEVTDGRISFEISLDTVNLWSTEDPQLYTCESVIETEGERDVSVDQFGFRTIEFVANKGMYLNGVHTKLKGMCLHHDAGCLGAAAWEEVWKKRLLMLKEMGCNAIRTTSNPYPSMILKLFDVHTSEELLRLQEIFIKGRPDPVRDEAHLNFEINKERPTGPFSEKVIGRWKAGEYQYEFQENGSLVRYVGKFQETIGYWWYDFPVDCFETPDYAGTGEVWYITGEKNKMEFTDQSCTCLKLDNTNGAMAAAWKKEEELLFTRI